MKTPALAELSVNDLVRLYVEICLRQDNAILMGESSRFNREFKRMVAVEAELKSRPGDGRQALVRLFDHPNAQVRLMSAIEGLARLEHQCASRCAGDRSLLAWHGINCISRSHCR